MKVDLNWKLKTLEGKPMENENEELIHAGKIVANVLSTSVETEHPIKYLDWALKLYNKQALDLDKADAELFTKFIKTSNKLLTITKAQVLNHLSEQKPTQA